MSLANETLKGRFTFSPNIAINVRDRAKAFQFYETVLGLPFVREHECGLEMKAGSNRLWIDHTDDDQRIGFVFFEFLVEDLKEAIRILEAQGCKLEQPTSGPGFVGQMIVDPYGMRFHLYHAIREGGAPSHDPT